MTRLVLRFLLAVVPPGILPLFATAYAQPAPSDKAKIKQAKAYVDAGLAAQGGGDYDTAITLYSKAYELVPHPVLLFNMAQAHRLAGHSDEAKRIYQRFLATNPTGAEAQIARDLLAELTKRKAEQTRRIEQATKARKDGRFEDARVELEAAYALEPQPDLLYALGQVYAKIGNCGEADTYYKRLIVTQKDPKIAKVVDQEIVACKSMPHPVREPPQLPASSRPPPDKLQPKIPPDRPSHPAGNEPALSQAEQPPVPPPQVLARVNSAPTPAAPQQGWPWYKNKLGDALVLGGVALTAVALVEYRNALSDITSARSAPTYGLSGALVRSAHDKRVHSVMLAGGGSALIGTGIICYVFRGGTTHVGMIGVAPARGSGMITYQGRF